jgi:hypothetical protein
MVHPALDTPRGLPARDYDGPEGSSRKRPAYTTCHSGTVSGAVSRGREAKKWRNHTPEIDDYLDALKRRR